MLFRSVSQSRYGGWGNEGTSQSSGGSVSQGGGTSESGSKAGTNDEQIAKYLQQAYGYQSAELLIKSILDLTYEGDAKEDAGAEELPEG